MTQLLAKVKNRTRNVNDQYKKSFQMLCVIFCLKI